jgi:hypothetical protein
MSIPSDMNRGFLKEKLGSYQVDPPEKVWNEISGKIEGGHKGRRMLLILLVTAASVALAITLGINYFGPDLPLQNAYMETLSPEVDETQENSPGDAARQSDEPAVEPLDLPVAHSQVTTGPEPAKVSEMAARPTLATLSDPATGSELATSSDPATGSELATSSDPAAGSELATSSEPAAGPELATIPSIKPEPGAATDLSADPFPLMEKDRKRDSRWMLGAAISPLYSFRDAEAGAITDNQAESGTISYSTGVQVSYRRNSRFAIETGIYYNKTGIAIGSPGIQLFNQRQDNLIFGTGSEQANIKTVSNSVGNIIAYSGDIYMNGYKINAESGAYYSDANSQLNQVSDSESGIQQHLDYLEIPFNIRYSVIDRAIELQLVGGLSTNFLVSNYVTMETSSGQEEIGYLSNINTVNYSGNAGVGMIYHLGGSLSLILEPRFRYFLNSINDSSLPSTRPYSLGLYTGLSFTF